MPVHDTAVRLEGVPAARAGPPQAKRRHDAGKMLTCLPEPPLPKLRWPEPWLDHIRQASTLKQDRLRTFWRVSACRAVWRVEARGRQWAPVFADLKNLTGDHVVPRSDQRSLRRVLRVLERPARETRSAAIHTDHRTWQPVQIRREAKPPYTPQRLPGTHK